MTATIHYLNPPLRVIPTQEIRSLYEDLYLEQVRKQEMERVMKDLHDKMHPDAEFDYRLWWLVVLPFWGFIAFVIGYGVGRL